MATIFTITTDLIKKLNDSQARELVARLCKAELRAQGLTESGVTWGGDQRAKDGGVDVRVECNQPLTSLNYIKHQNTAIQVKAEKFSPSKIPNEMAPKGNVRSALIELGTMGGAYIIVSTRDDLSDSSLLARKTKISAVLKAHGLEGKIGYDFYDARQIADWVEQYPALANWVRHELGQSFTGWQPYGSWAYHEDDVSDEYLVDERVRVFVLGQDKGSDINSAIEQLRSELSQPASVRIVGLSGVGKTRLAQALFDVRIGVAAKAPSPDNVVYTDLADEPTPQPKEMLEELVSRDSDCVVVIDNCGSDTHQRLTEIIKRKGSQLRLLTIEYDIRDDLPESTSCFRLEGVSNQIIRKLLENRYQILSGNDTRKIAEFSDGNARVAFALASTANTNGEMAKLQDAELFKRLFHQKNNPNDDLLRCAEIASLLYSFDGEDMSETSEVALLANIAETTPRAFSRHMA
ncbi:MAG: hypothetical protein GXP14_08075, partial [Gammaproteobacteria bacterium]|nr:hypothetical protein [Gammaproteobacteria bacterium]